ncbi:MAG: hypothetical protein KDA63_16985 [Planctomycetales bacterium]|nr:hypothetical protein [Planctomycetales bacterium]
MFQVTVHYVGGKKEAFEFADVDTARDFMRARDKSDRVAFTTVSIWPRHESHRLPFARSASHPVAE